MAINIEKLKPLEGEAYWKFVSETAKRVAKMPRFIVCGSHGCDWTGPQCIKCPIRKNPK